MDELMLCVAPCPGEKQTERFPGSMNVADEVVRACGAGACIAHLHVRDRAGLQTTDLRWFREDVAAIRAACPIIIEGSTGGAPEHTLAERAVSFQVEGVELGSLNLGSVNMYDGVYANPIGDIEFYATRLQERGIKPILNIFDLSHLESLWRLLDSGLAAPPFVFNLVFDVPNALPYRDRHVTTLLRELPKDAVWFLTHHHAAGSEGFHKALELGGHVRAGYEDGPFLADGRRARSNVELIEEIARAAQAVGRRVASPSRAREILSISPE